MAGNGRCLLSVSSRLFAFFQTLPLSDPNHEEQTMTESVTSPVPNPNPWQSVFDESSQSWYWWNTETGETTWDDPHASISAAVATLASAVETEEANEGTAEQQQVLEGDEDGEKIEDAGESEGKDEEEDEDLEAEQRKMLEEMEVNPPAEDDDEQEDQPSGSSSDDDEQEQDDGSNPSQRKLPQFSLDRPALLAAAQEQQQQHQDTASSSSNAANPSSSSDPNYDYYNSPEYYQWYYSQYPGYAPPTTSSYSDASASVAPAAAAGSIIAASSKSQDASSSATPPSSSEEHLLTNTEGYPTGSSSLPGTVSVPPTAPGAGYSYAGAWTAPTVDAEGLGGLQGMFVGLVKILKMDGLVRFQCHMLRMGFVLASHSFIWISLAWYQDVLRE
jgi:hypothetical protein